MSTTTKTSFQSVFTGNDDQHQKLLNLIQACNRLSIHTTHFIKYYHLNCPPELCFPHLDEANSLCRLRFIQKLPMVLVSVDRQDKYFGLCNLRALIYFSHFPKSIVCDMNWLWSGNWEQEMPMNKREISLEIMAINFEIGPGLREILHSEHVSQFFSFVTTGFHQFELKQCNDPVLLIFKRAKMQSPVNPTRAPPLLVSICLDRLFAD